MHKLGSPWRYKYFALSLSVLEFDLSVIRFMLFASYHIRKHMYLSARLNAPRRSGLHITLYIDILELYAHEFSTTPMYGIFQKQNTKISYQYRNIFRDCVL